MAVELVGSGSNLLVLYLAYINWVPTMELSKEVSHMSLQIVLVSNYD
jgi:hypothetical protein